MFFRDFSDDVLNRRRAGLGLDPCEGRIVADLLEVYSQGFDYEVRGLRSVVGRVVEEECTFGASR